MTDNPKISREEFRCTPRFFLDALTDARAKGIDVDAMQAEAVRTGDFSQITDLAMRFQLASEPAEGTA